MASPAPSISNRTFDLPPRLAVATRSTRVDDDVDEPSLDGGGGAGAGAGFTVVGFADAMTASFARASLSVFSLVSFAVSVVRTASFASSLELALELATAAARPAAAGEENFFNHAGSLSLPSPPSSRSAGISMIFLRLGVSVDALACRANPRRRQWCSFFKSHRVSSRARKRSHPVVASPSPASSRETHLDRTPHAFEETRERFKLVIIARIVVDDDHDESIDRSARHRLTTRPSRERPRRRARVMELDAPGEIVISSVPGLGFAVDIIEPAPERGRARRGDALVVHGLNAHARSPNVRAMCVALAKRGYRAITFDLPGHGACEGEGSVRGIYTGKEETATRARRALEAAGATRAAMVVGSSMGGALAIYIVNSMREMGDVVVERVVLINPLLKMKTYVPGAALAALRLVSLAVPAFPVSARPTDLVQDPELDFDHEAQKQVDADELTFKGPVRLRTALELYDVTRHNAGARAEDCGMVRLSFQTPVLLVTGERDVIVPPETAIDRARLAISAGGKAEHVEFKRCGHSLTLTSVREDVFDLIADWRWK